MEDREHPFFALPPRAQLSVQLRVGAAVVAAIGALVATALGLEHYWMLSLGLVPLQIAAPFIDGPSGKRSGSLVYYAPLFLVEPRSDGSAALHGGTLFDYWFVFDRSMDATARKRRVLYDYVRGLIALAEQQQQTGGPSFELYATTYFIGPAMAKRAGFVPTAAHAGVALLWLNIIQLTLAYSLVSRRVRIPPVHRSRSYEASIETVVSRLPQLRALEARLRRLALAPRRPRR